MSMSWPAFKLDEICHKITDGSHNPPKGVESSEYVMLSSRNIFNDQITFDKPRFLRKCDFDVENKRTDVNPGDVLLTIVGTVGRVAVAPEGAPKFTLQRSVAVLKPKIELLGPRFLMYALQSMLEQLTAGARGVAQKGIYLKALREMLIPLPSLSEQKRIVAILDEAFAGIDTAIANTEKNLANARELFENLIAERVFGDPDTRGWFQATVADLARPEKGSIRTGPFGSQLLHSEFVDDGIAVLGIDNAVQNSFAWNKRRYITEAKYSELKRYTVYPGDVLITIMGTCGRCAVVPDDIPLSINTKHLCCISLDQSKCIPRFLHYYFLYHPIARGFLESRAKGSIMSGLNMAIIRELPVRLPDIQIQNRVVATIDETAGEIRLLESIYQKKLTALAELKQSLLQKAFSGELTAGKGADSAVKEEEVA